MPKNSTERGWACAMTRTPSPQYRPTIELLHKTCSSTRRLLATLPFNCTGIDNKRAKQINFKLSAKARHSR